MPFRQSKKHLDATGARDSWQYHTRGNCKCCLQSTIAAAKVVAAAPIGETTFTPAAQ